MCGRLLGANRRKQLLFSPLNFLGHGESMEGAEGGKGKPVGPSGPSEGHVCAERMPSGESGSLLEEVPQTWRRGTLVPGRGGRRDGACWLGAVAPPPSDTSSHWPINGCALSPGPGTEL